MALEIPESAKAYIGQGEASTLFAYIFRSSRLGIGYVYWR